MDRATAPAPFRALVWSVANSGLSRLLSFATGAVLARLLAPEAYGAFAVGLLALALLQSANELGTSVVVVRWGEGVERVARTAMTLSVATAGCLALSCALAAPAIARVVGIPDATPVLRVVALCVLIDGISSIPNALLTRAFLQSRRAVADLAGTVVTGVVAIVLARSGHGAAGLAWAAVAGNAVCSALVLALAPARPRPGWSRADAAILLRGGAPLAASSLVALAVLNVDYLIVGRVLGPAALGTYLLVFNLANWPVNLLGPAMRRVALPGFAEAHRTQPSILHRRFVDASEAVVTSAAAAAVAIAVLAEPLVRVLYGDRWAGGAPALRWLAWFAACRLVLELLYDLLAAVGRGGVLLRLELLWLVLLVPAATVGGHVGGIAGVGAAHAAVAVLVVLPAHLLVVRSSGVDPSHALVRWVGPLLAALVAGGTGVAATVGRSAPTGLALGAAAVGLVYVALVAPRLLALRASLGASQPLAGEA